MSHKQKDRRSAHQDFVKRLRDQHERDTGHTPTDRDVRRIEELARKQADQYDRSK